MANERVLRTGDCVFFSEVKTSTHRKAQAVRFKGFGFGLLLGIVPPFGKDPGPVDFFRLMGQAGYLSFDDVGEFLGPEVGVEILKQFEKKYYSPPPPVETLSDEGVAEVLDGVNQPKHIDLIDSHGNPLKQEMRNDD